jgi:multicomponent Na+:H+ antiporter subunit C
MTMEEFFGLYNYWVVVFLMMTGFYIVIARKNMIKTIIGLNIFQISVVLLYVTMGKVTGGTAPIIPPNLAGHSDGEHGAHDSHGGHEVIDHAHDHAGEAAEIIYSNPLPSVLMLTAIVVGIATTALALALIVRISEDYGTIEEDEILLMDRQR